jgi:urease accessory protein
MTHPGIFFSNATWNAKLKLEYAARDGLTIPTLREHEGPLRIQKGFRAEAPEAPQVWHQYLLHPPGGIAQGDRLRIEVSARDGAHVLLTTPGANKWYRADEHSSGAQQHVALNLQSAILEWLPQETIYFSGTLARNELVIRASADSTLLCAEVYCLGRPASDERFTTGRLHLRTQLWIDDELEFSEQAVVAGADPQLQSQSGLASRPIMGQFLAYSAHCQASDAELIRTILAQTMANAVEQQQIEFGITRIPRLQGDGSFIILRCRCSSSALAWQAVRTAWAQLRPRWTGLEAHPPRIWST